MSTYNGKHAGPGGGVVSGRGDGGPAYPQPLWRNDCGEVSTPGDYGPFGGMSLRDMLAKSAPQYTVAADGSEGDPFWDAWLRIYKRTHPMPSSTGESERWAVWCVAMRAAGCYAWADAMLAAREGAA